MPTKSAQERADRDRREGKSPSTQAGEFVKEEIDRIRQGEHGARSPQQAIAIGLSEARRAGVNVPPNPHAKHGGTEKSGGARRRGRNRGSAKRSRATLKALKREPRDTVSREELSKQGRRSARERSPRERHLAAVKAIHTKGRRGLSNAGRKAARTRKEAA